MVATRQLTGKINLPITRVANISIELDPQPDKTINSSPLASNPELSNTLSLNQYPDEGVPIPDLEFPASISSASIRALTLPSPSTPTPAPTSYSQSAPAPSPSPAPWPNSVRFGPRISEALPCATMVQAPPPPIEPLTNYLKAKAMATIR